MAIEAMCLLGLRFGELAGLQARDFDWDRMELIVHRVAGNTSAGGPTKLETFIASITTFQRPGAS